MSPGRVPELAATFQSAARFADAASAGRAQRRSADSAGGVAGGWPMTEHETVHADSHTRQQQARRPHAIAG